MGNPVVELVKAEKIYRSGESDVVGLAEVDFRVERAEFVSIMGASGSGKSTMLNVIGTLDRLDGGSYRFEGEPIESFDDEELSLLRSRKIGFIFQSFHLLSHYTAVENVELPMVYAGIPRRERRARALAALERVGLGHRVDHRPVQMSGGQQQRVSIARALVNAPSLLLADEPTGALDSRTTREILDLFSELNDQGVTLVLVTHEDEVARQAKRVVRMRDARIISDKPVAHDEVSALGRAESAAPMGASAGL